MIISLGLSTQTCFQSKNPSVYYYCLLLRVLLNPQLVSKLTVWYNRHAFVSLLPTEEEPCPKLFQRVLEYNLVTLYKSRFQKL